MSFSLRSSRFADPPFSRPEMPREHPRETLSRIVDNRMRAITVWVGLGARQKFDPNIKICLDDLAANIAKFRRRSPATHEWFDQLSGLVDQIDLSKPGTFEPVYEHVGRYPPKILVGPTYIPRRDPFFEDIFGDRKRRRIH